MKATQATIDSMQNFNRFYTVRLGFLNQNYLGTGYSVTEMRILFEISESAAVTARYLCDLLRLDKSYISRIIRSMEQRGLVYREVSAADRRALELRLTALGKQEIDRLNAATAMNIETMLDPFDEAEQQMLCDAMTCIMKKLSQIEG